MAHITVLQKEAVEALHLSEDSVVVDCTFGAGGHAKEILTHLNTDGVFVGFDRDQRALDAFAATDDTFDATVHLFCSNFAEIKDKLQELNLRPNAILADLGWRSEQFEDGKRGFSFTADEPLLMTYGNPAEYTFTAADIVNDWEEESIADIIYGYGEERYARRIAKAIVETRMEKPIKTAKELSMIIETAVPAVYRRGRINPATKTFQALRIAVNDELAVLKTLLSEGFDLLAPGGRMAIITFHSLEDRIVKQFFKEQSHDQKGVRITKKPIRATDEEQAMNPRARSAKLRVFEKTKHETISQETTT